jgi:cobalt-zinc-cadmium efflux system outer membrane protein
MEKRKPSWTRHTAPRGAPGRRRVRARSAKAAPRPGEWWATRERTAQRARVALCLVPLVFATAAASWAQEGPSPAALTAPGPSTGSGAPPDAASRLLASLSDPVVRELVSDALERNPAVAAAEARARAARQQAPLAKALPDPTIGITGYVAPPETRVGPQRLMLSLSQRFPWFGKISLREDAALRQAEALAAGVASQRLALVTEVRRLFYEVAFLDVYRSVVEADRQTLVHFEELARARYASGVGIEQGVVKIQAEITRDDNRLLDVAARRAALVATLNALRDRPSPAPIPPFELPRTALTQAPTLEALRTKALAQRPELAAADADIERADILIEQAGKEYKPDLTVGVTWTAVGERNDPAGMLQPPPDNGSDVFGISASLNLPIKRGRLRAGVEEAADARLAAVERKRDVTTTIDQALGELAERVRLSGEQVRLFERVLVLQAEQSLRSAESGYASGGLNSLDLLDAERTVLDVRTGAARARADHAIALARLEGTIGGPLTPGTEGAER